MRGKTFSRMLAEVSALDDESFNVEELATHFEVSESTVLFDVLTLKRWGLVTFFPVVGDGVCELCDEQNKRVTHHWKDCHGFHTRALCVSCNQILGHIFRGNYPSWRDQVEAFVWRRGGYCHSDLGNIFRGTQ